MKMCVECTIDNAHPIFPSADLYLEHRVKCHGERLPAVVVPVPADPPQDEIRKAFRDFADYFDGKLEDYRGRLDVLQERVTQLEAAPAPAPAPGE